MELYELPYVLRCRPCERDAPDGIVLESAAFFTSRVRQPPIGQFEFEALDSPCWFEPTEQEGTEEPENTFKSGIETVKTHELRVTLGGCLF